MFFKFFKIKIFGRTVLPNHRIGKTRDAGFTALELLVVIGIFTIMTGVVLANLPKFRDQTSVGLVAQQIALVARQAQVYGNSGRLINGLSVQGYGLMIDITPSTGSDTSFVLFGNKVQTPTQLYTYAIDELSETFTLPGGIKIPGIERVPSSCLNGGYSGETKMHIIFRRAYPDAQFFSAFGSPLSCTCSKITIESTRNPSLKKEIVIWSTGHIYTKDPSSGC